MVPESDLDSLRDIEPPVVCIPTRYPELGVKGSDLLLLQSIDQALSDLLGRRAKEAIYDYLERRCYMSTDEIPRRLAEFCRILQASFGKGGYTIQKTIARRFYSRLGKSFIDYPGYTLVDYVEKAVTPPNIRVAALDVPMRTTSVTTYVFSDSGSLV
jgi:hypothetical protein